MHPLVEAFKVAFPKELEEKLLAPAASEEEIEAFKQKVLSWGLPALPEVFYDFYRWHNGSGEGVYKWIRSFDGDSILPLSRIISDKEMWDDLENQDTFKNYERGTWWNKAWIPFLYIPDWWVGVIDTQGCFGGKAGQILGFDFKSAEGKSISHESFEKWLETMLALQKAHLLYTQTEDEETNYLTAEQENHKRDIFKKINGDFAFHVEIWQFRRKESPENPHWQTLEESIKKQDFETAKSLIESGKVGLNEQNLYIMERLTPLLLALDLDAFSLATWIIRQGADLTAKDCYGYDAFWKIKDAYSKRKISNIVEHIELLLENGYQPKDPFRPHWLAHVAEDTVKFQDWKTLDFCLSQGFDINKVAADYCFKTLLHDVVTANRPLDSAKALIERGLDKTLKNKAGKTALELYQDNYKIKEDAFKMLGKSISSDEYKAWVALLS